MTCLLNQCEYCSNLNKNNYKDNCTEELNNNITLEDLDEVISNIRDKALPTEYEYSQQDLYIRTNIIGYMDRICSMLGIPDDSFFIAVDIFDEFSKKFSYSLDIDDFTLVGLTCIFMACKVFEGKTIELNFMVETLGQGKFERDDFLMTEILILKTLSFRIPNNYFIDFVNCVLKYILPTLDCIAVRELYGEIKNAYKNSLYTLHKRGNILVIYMSIVYDTLKYRQCLTVNMNSAIINANFNRLSKYYKISFKNGEYKNRTIYSEDLLMTVECK